MLSLCTLSVAFSLPTSRVQSTPNGLRACATPQMAFCSRRQALVATGTACLVGLPNLQAAFAEEQTTKNGVAYSVLQSGKEGGGKPKLGDLVAIRFKGSVKASGAVFDDILASPEPYYTRLGSYNVLPAVEEVLPLMRTGDKWQLTVPGKLGFGEKGRSASPGKPRIPSNAELDFILELVAVPGRDEEILESGSGDSE